MLLDVDNDDHRAAFRAAARVHVDTAEVVGGQQPQSRGVEDVDRALAVSHETHVPFHHVRRRAVVAADLDLLEPQRSLDAGG
jgi:hypothetical protein